MCSHLDMNTKPIPGLLAWVIAHSLPPSRLLLSFIPSSTPATPLSPSLSPPCKLDSGNITMLFSLFPSLWPNCLVFQDHWALFIGCNSNQRATQVFFLSQGCFRAKMGPINGFHSTAHNTTSGYWWLPAPRCTVWPIYHRKCKQMLTRGAEITCSTQVPNSSQSSKKDLLNLSFRFVFGMCRTILTTFVFQFPGRDDISTVTLTQIKINPSSLRGIPTLEYCRLIFEE